MVISLLRWLAFLASLFFFLVYFKGGTAVFKDARRTMANAARRTYMAAVILMCFPALTILLTQFLTCLGIVSGLPLVEHWSTVLSGTILNVTGIFALFWIRYRYLGRFWSGSVEIREQHQVMDQGPYQLVRHPLYAFSVVIYL